ncbi:unnamed protein product [Cuscuta epithymum]|uniref:Pentatricopeptide repeat-containing protein n=1 Tax=Cuscuta epithymum TaxID=186058 RepID=A0AAV0ELV3_9ASTE|nr:unnamed protein product [Cuscuta epithymum]CAH9123525.1 unnamed protein product [Cuscuta epithymum]
MSHRKLPKLLPKAAAAVIVPASHNPTAASYLPLSVLDTTIGTLPAATQTQLTRLVQTHLKPSFTPKDLLSFLKKHIHYHPTLTHLDFHLFRYAASVDSFRHDHSTFEWMCRTLAISNRLDSLSPLLQFIAANPCPCADGIFSCPRTEPIFRFAINAFCKSGRFDDALLAFDTMKRLIDGKPEAAMYNIIIHGFVKFRNYGKALGFYDRMIHDRVKPDLITFNTLISGHCRNAQLGLALQMFKEMKNHRCVPNVVTFNTLIKRFLIEGKIEEGIGMAYEMVELGHGISSVTCDILVNELCRIGMFTNACNVLIDFSRKGVMPNGFDYFDTVERLCSEGNVGGALELVNELWSRGNAPSPVACTTLIEGLRKESKIEEASMFLKHMLNECIVPDGVTFNCLLSSMCSAGKSCEANELRLLASSKGLQLDAMAYTILISGFTMEGKRKEGEILLDEMLDVGFIPDIFTYNRFKDELGKV